MLLSDQLKDSIRIIPDFPKSGILFKDITPVFYNPKLVKDCVLTSAEYFRNDQITKVIGIESRGFLLGPMIAQELNCGFVIVRKKGKLPRNTLDVTYDLEYGTETLEIHQDAINGGDRIIIHDDLLATGGTASAVAQLCKKCKAIVVGFSFLVHLKELPGKNAINKYSSKVCSLVEYEN